MNNGIWGFVGVNILGVGWIVFVLLPSTTMKELNVNGLITNFLLRFVKSGFKKLNRIVRTDFNVFKNIFTAVPLILIEL